MGDKHGKRQEQFQRQGWQIGFSKCSSIGADTRRNLRRRMAKEKPRLLYIVEFGGMDNSTSVSSFLGNMVDDQLKLCGLILIEAPENTPTWTSPHGKRSEGEE